MTMSSLTFRGTEQVNSTSFSFAIKVSEAVERAFFSNISIYLKSSNDEPTDVTFYINDVILNTTSVDGEAYYTFEINQGFEYGTDVVFKFTSENSVDIWVETLLENKGVEGVVAKAGTTIPNCVIEFESTPYEKWNLKDTTKYLGYPYINSNLALTNKWKDITNLSELIDKEATPAWFERYLPWVWKIDSNWNGYPYAWLPPSMENTAVPFSVYVAKGGELIPCAVYVNGKQCAVYINKGE